MRDDRQYLRHVLDSIEAIEEFAASGRGSFMNDRKTQFAVIRAFEVIGEAAKRLSPEARMAQPQIPWRRVTGFRDYLIHNYFLVDLKVVWETIERDLPLLKRAVQEMLAESGE